jgi:hypothetical protein
MRNAPAFVSALLLALVFIDWPGSGYFLSGAGLIVFGPIVATRAVEAALWTIAAILDACRAPPARIVAAIAALAALGAGLTAACAEPLARKPGDIVYLPSLAIRADGRLALADGATLAAAARAYAGPGDYWAATCRATLPGWYRPIEWTGLDAVNAPLWRATVSGAGVVEVSGLSPSEADPLRALLEELAPIVACH